MIKLEIAYVLVQCKIAHEMEVLKALLEIDIVKEAKGTFGYYDILVKIQAESHDIISETITKKNSFNTKCNNYCNTFNSTRTRLIS